MFKWIGFKKQIKYWRIGKNNYKKIFKIKKTKKKKLGFQKTFIFMGKYLTKN